MPLRILIVNDECLVRVGLASVLDADSRFRVVGVANNSAEAVRLLPETKADVVLLAPDPLDESSIAAIRDLSTANEQTGILLVEADHDPELVREALLAGASGFVRRDSSVEELYDAVHVVSRGGLYAHAATVRGWLRRMPHPPHSQGLHLSPRQLEILKLVAVGHANAEIARRLFISERTVEYHRHNIAEVLHVHDRAGLVRIALESGLLTAESTE